MLIRVWPVIGSRYEVRIFGFLRFRLGGEREREVWLFVWGIISLFIFITVVGCPFSLPCGCGLLPISYFFKFFFPKIALNFKF